jgi:hypothetical protein
MPTCQSRPNAEAKVNKYIGTRDFVSLAYLRPADCTTGSFSSHPAAAGLYERYKIIPGICENTHFIPF